MASSVQRLVRLVVQAVFLVFLAACAIDVILQGGLSDVDANEVVTLVKRDGVAVNKVQAAGGVTLTVLEGQLARAAAQAVPLGDMGFAQVITLTALLVNSPLQARGELESASVVRQPPGGVSAAGTSTMRQLPRGWLPFTVRA